MRLLISFLLLLATGYILGCKSSNDGGITTVTITVTAPTIVSPASGSEDNETQPTLVVSNVTVSDGSTPSYTFQVASDSGFSDIVAQEANVAQGTSGQTSWQVTVELTNGQYFWRAKAIAGTTDGAYSSTADFTIRGVLMPGDVVVLSDPLTNGSTLGEAEGGEFTDQGWKVERNEDYLRYEVHSISNGFVQWENTGLALRGATVNSHMLLSMWDPDAGKFTKNRFRVNIQKLWEPAHNPPWLRLRWISGSEQHDAESNFNSWDPSQIYTFRLQWGPAQGAHTTKLFLNGNEIMQVRYTKPYIPNTHWIELGNASREESVINAVYANVVIGKR